jgi:hypothetical protein
MNFNHLPIIAKDNIFKYIFKYLGEDKYTFFYQILRLREVNREFNNEVSKILLNFFILKNIYPYNNLTTLEDAKSVFLKSILDNYSSPEFLNITYDHKDRLVCESCSKILSDEAFLPPDTIGYVAYEEYSESRLVERFDPRYNIICWDCTLTWSLAYKEPYCRLEDNLDTCLKVNDFVSKFI